MGTDADFVLEFARTEYFEIARDQLQTRMLALAILGGVMPIFLAILFPSTADSDSSLTVAGLTRRDILALVLIGLSFAYALLAITYTSQSRKHDRVVSVLEVLQPKFREKFVLDGKELPLYFRPKDVSKSEGPQGSLKWFIDHIWTFINAGIFGVPCVLAMVFSIYLRWPGRRDWIKFFWGRHAWITVFWCVVAIANGVIVVVIILTKWVFP